MKKRVLPTLILVFCMMLALATTAFAEDGEKVAAQNSVEYTSFSALAEAIEGLAYDSSTNTLSLTGAVNLNGAINLYADVTLDLNGYGLTSNYGGVYVWSGDVIITDSSSAGTGSITGNSDRAVQVSGSDASLTINGGTLNGSSYGAMAFSESTLTINGGTIYGVYGIYAASSSATIKDGTVSGTSVGAEVRGGATLTMTGGKITSPYMGVRLIGGTVDIKAGTVEATEEGYFPIIVFPSTDSAATNYSNLTVGADATIAGCQTEGASASYVFINYANYTDNTQYVAYGVNVEFSGTTKNTLLYVQGLIKNTENYPVINIYDPAYIDKGIYAAGYAEWNIYGGTITTDSGCGIEIRAGILNVYGGSISSTDSPASTDPNGNGTTSTGAGIAVVEHTTKLGVTVNVYDGEISGYYALYQNDTQNNGSETGGIEISVYDGELTTTDESSGAAVYVTSTGYDENGEATEESVISIFGGTYNTEVDEDYLDDSVTTVATYTSTDSTTYSYFASTEDALASSQAGAVVTSLDEEETTTYTVLRAATCTTTGVTKVVNGETTKYVSIPATGHSYSYTWEWAEDYSSATVTAVCTVCQDEATAEAEEVASETTTEAACTTEGVITYTATAEVDGETVTDTQTASVSATGHTEAVKYTGNCTVGTAKKVTYCTVCEEELSSESIAQTSHHSYVYDEDDVVWTPVTDNDGTVTGYTLSVTAHCMYCEKTNTATKDVVATYTVTEEPTCTTEGTATVTADTARLYWYDEETESASTIKVLTLTTEVSVAKLSATGEHNYVEDVIDATCTEAAYVTEVCSICGETNPDAEKVAVEESEPLGHNYVSEVTTAATCTEDGVMTYTCSRCGDTYTEEIAATGHTWNEGEYQDATCTEADSVLYTCTVCGETYTEEIGLVPATGHAAGEAVIENEVAATCTEDGSYDSVVYCTKCGEEISRETITVEATGHTYVAVVTEPTCKEGGYTTYTCSACGDSYTADETEAVADAHDYVLTSTLKAADCTTATNGVGKYTCSVCGATKYAVIAYEHTWEKVEGSGSAATCTEDGSMEYICTVCAEAGIDTAKTETIEATGHTAGEAVTENEVAATCGTDGSYDSVVYCTVCGEEISRETVTIPATGAHSYGAEEVAEDGVTIIQVCSVCGDTVTVGYVEHTHAYETVVTEPTCKEGGYTTYTCSICGDTYTGDETEALGHTTKVQNAQEATCTEDGYTGDEVCTVCSETVTTGEVIPATGHTAGEAVTENSVAATCTTDGSYESVVYCTVCGAEISRETVAVPATGHTEEVVDGYDATCTETGLTDGVVCSVCGEVLMEQEVIPAKGHTEGEAVIENEVAATCTEAGSYDSVVYCTICDEELSRETITVPATGHSYGEGVVTEPTCTVGGYTTYTCSVCGDSYVADETEATGHTEGEPVKENEVAATCTEDGSYDSVVYCTECGEEISRETVTVSATGHTTEVQNAKAATCTENGYTGDEVCTVCGETISTGEVIPATGHSTETQNAKTATCTEDGYTGDEVCTVCGETVTTGETIPATGHTYGEPEYTWGEDEEGNVTCTATFTCSVCEDEQEVECAVEAGEVVAATCTTDGTTEYTATCTFNGKTYTTTETIVTEAATGHTYVLTYDEENDTYIRVCSECGVEK